MSNLLGKNYSSPISDRQMLLNKFNSARSNLLLLVIFSAINLIMLATGSGAYFLFSATIPYTITDLAMFFCGMYPEEFYTGDFAGMIFADQGLFVAALIISLIIIGTYLLCWFLSRKNKVGWLITALSFFCADTLFMFLYYGISASIIIDILFHGWIIFILINGISAYYKMKKLPPEENMIEGEFTEISDQDSVLERKLPDTTPLRPIDNDAKSRILLEAEIYGRKITYRRVKRTNELIIDENVYDEYSALAEMPHMLTANLDGHAFAAGLDNMNHSYILVDGKTVISKMRWI